jgi:hypothetical protein
VQIRSFVIVGLLAVALSGSAGAATAPGTEPAPTLDQLAAQVRDLRAAVVKLQIANGQLQRQVTALNGHTHSLGEKVVGGGMSSVTLVALRDYLNNNRCPNCVIEMATGAKRAVPWVSGPPILPQP